MKPCLFAITAVLCMSGFALNAQASNEAAGLPDLDAINHPGGHSAGQVSSKVEIDTPRAPSFHEKSPTGTEITEYRDKGKPVEIDVHSGFGTRYQMSAPADTAPTVHNSGQPSTRFPSIHLRY